MNFSIQKEVTLLKSPLTVGQLLTLEIVIDQIASLDPMKLGKSQTTLDVSQKLRFVSIVIHSGNGQDYIYSLNEWAAHWINYLQRKSW